MKICYREISFRQSSLELINIINSIIYEYMQKGYDLTLRQVYYQLVARSVIENTERSYKNIGNLISDGRMSGLIDWDSITDRTRGLRKNSHWNSPQDIILACIRSYAQNKWEGQDYYVEVWVEKDALIGVLEKACNAIDVPRFSCRGYVSQSEMWVAANRLIEKFNEGHLPVIIHLGDHDPSGKDMSRDILDRLKIFNIKPIFERIALNYDQIELYNPPPNPTKITDTRAQGYIKEFGHECWELDALRPEVIEKLIHDKITEYLDISLYRKIEIMEECAKRTLRRVADNWTNIEDQYS